MSDEKPTTSPSSGGGGSPAAGAGGSCPVSEVPVVHARIRLLSVTFSGGHDIDNDTFGNFPAPHFLEGRAPDALPTRQLPAQFPYAYTRGTKLRVTAVFSVSQQPTGTEPVAIHAEAVVAGTRLKFRSTVTVSPADTEVRTPVITSDVDLPNTIQKIDPLIIDWFQTPCDVGRRAAGSSTNTLYITLGAPTIAPLFWTLLDISCAAATGESTIAGLRSRSYAALQVRDIKRKRDSHDLTYWNPRTTRATRTRLLLAASDGSGQCGSWAEFLVDMWKAHGDDGGHKVGIARSIADWLSDSASTSFLVKHWRFDPPHPIDPRSFPYALGVKCIELPGVPGQNSSNPPPAFLNHFIVVAGGVFYDPSYGSPTFTTKLAWENASIDGLDNGTHAGYRKSVLSGDRLLEFMDLDTGTML